MSGSPARPAVTLAAAAEELGVRPQRVNQLLTAGELRGPRYQGRAPKNAPRVWVDSLEILLVARARRSPASKTAGNRDLARRVKALEEALLRMQGWEAVPRELEEAQAKERAARNAALDLKVAADAALAALESEQLRSKELALENERLRTTSRQAEERARAERAARQSYSASLRPFLVPDDPRDLDTPS